ncbi:MAG TPA: DUF5916 domain-containing protein [Cyclobacteriaceae bacterium]|nr:DUF5916 domain-containing protein [Cyclobacteriaceae bacterium]
MVKKILAIKISFTLLFILSVLDLVRAQDRFELSFLARARSKRIPQKTIKISKSSSEIVVDGVLNEPAWTDSEKANDFFQQFPSDNIKAVTRTEASLTYDDHNIYFGITCYDDSNEKYIVESLRRDFRIQNNDYLMVVLDPYDNLNNGLVFALTPLGVQMEGLLSAGGAGFMPVSSSWDNIWYSRVRKTKEGWIAEVKIPFKAIRYNDQVTDWNIQIIRNDLKRNERSTWTRVQKQFQPTTLSSSGRMKWDSLPPHAGANISLIPFLSGSATQDMEVDGKIKLNGKTGFDAKVALSSSLNLDLTANPDFSTVEADQQMTNITRFELFYPERRQFFLENSDLFSQFGFWRSQVFFSRRIGLDSPLLFGTRLSGQMGSGIRVGLMNTQTDSKKIDDGDDNPAYNFTVAAFRKQLFGRSNIGGIFVNKMAVNFDKDEANGFDFGSHNRYNRIYGIQYNLLTPDDKWTGDFYVFRSDDPVHNNNNWSHGTNLRYNVRNFSVFWTHEYIGENFTAETGFFPRTGYFSFGPFINYRFYPKSKILNRHGPSFRFGNYLNKNWDITDRDISLNYFFDFANTSELNIQIQDTYLELLDDFDPTRLSESDTTIIPLPGGSNYRWQEGSIFYDSDNRKDFSFFVGASYGGFYNGTGIDVSGRVRYRIRPILNISFGFTYNNINLPDPYPDGSFWLIGPRLDLTFTENIYWTNFVQYNEQSDNININSRFQWRFAPASDLFLVYSENYFPYGLETKNRALILKISYWINL